MTKRNKTKHERDRDEYLRMNKSDNTMWWVVAFLITAVVAAALWNEARADDDTLAESIVLDAELESGEFILGTVGDDHISVQKQGQTTTGVIGGESVYIHETEIGDWKWTTGRVGDKTINIHEFGDDDDG